MLITTPCIIIQPTTCWQSDKTSILAVNFTRLCGRSIGRLVRLACHIFCCCLPTSSKCLLNIHFITYKQCSQQHTGHYMILYVNIIIYHQVQNSSIIFFSTLSEFSLQYNISNLFCGYDRFYTFTHNFNFTQIDFCMKADI